MLTYMPLLYACSISWQCRKSPCFVCIEGEHLFRVLGLCKVKASDK